MENEKKIYLFLQSLKGAGASENTINGYGLDLRLFFEKVNKNWTEVTAEDIELFFAELMDKRSKRTVARRLASVKAFYRYVCDKDDNFKNPSMKQKTPKLDKKLPKFLTPEEEDQLMNAAPSLRDKTVIRLLYVTGMRISEMWALNKDDIDFNSKRIKVFGKGGKERQVYLNSEVIDMLKEYFASRDDDNPALFVDKNGNRLSRRSVQKAIKSYGVKAGIKKKVTPHCQRHSFATTLLRNDIPLEVIQKAMGHSQMTTTLLYAQLNDSAVSDACHNVFDKK